MRSYLLYLLTLIKKYLVQLADGCASGKTTFNPESVSKFLIYKLMLLHLGARMLLPSDLHLYQIARQLDHIKKHAKLTFDLCNIDSDWTYIVGVIIFKDGADRDLDETKLSAGALSIYNQYYKDPITGFLPQNYLDQHQSIEERGKDTPYNWVSYEQFYKCVCLP